MNGSAFNINEKCSFLINKKRYPTFGYTGYLITNN